MLPINFEGANSVFNKPKEMEDEECMSLYARVGVDENSYISITTAWALSKEDLDEINQKGVIYITFLSNQLPPHYPSTELPQIQTSF